MNDECTLNGPEGDRRSLLVLLLIAFVVLAAGLGLRDPWPADEPRFALVAKHMVESGQWLFPFRGGQIYPDKPPLFMWCIAVLYRFTGSLRLAFMLPSLIAGLGCLALVHDMGRRLWDRQTAFRAGLLLLFTIQFTAQAKLAQIDMLVTGFITLGVYGFLRFLLCGGGWRWYYLGWFAAGLGVITKGVGILAPLVLIPALWTHRDELRAARRQAWLKGLAGPLAMIAAISLWLVPMLLVVQASHDSVLMGYRNDLLFHQTVTRYAEAWHHVQPFWYYLIEVVPIFWLPLALLLPWLVWRGRDAFRGRDRAFLLLAGYVLLVLVFFSISRGKRGVYITPATPALALLAAPSLPDLLARRWPPRLMRMLAWTLSLVFLVLAAVLMASPALAAKAAALGPHPWLLPLSLGITTACACLALWKAPMTSVFAVMALAWIHYGLWGYPLLNNVRSSKLLMAQVEEHVPGRSPLLIVGFREQQLLQGNRPVEHYPYGMKETVQAPLAAGWLLQGQDRWILGRSEFMHATFDTSKGIRLSAEGEDSWTLYRADAILPGHPVGPAGIPLFHYQPKE